MCLTQQRYQTAKLLFLVALDALLRVQRKSKLALVF